MNGIRKERMHLDLEKNNEQNSLNKYRIIKKKSRDITFYNCFELNEIWINLLCIECEQHLFCLY